MNFNHILFFQINIQFNFVSVISVRALFLHNFVIYLLRSFDVLTVQKILSICKYIVVLSISLIDHNNDQLSRSFVFFLQLSNIINKQKKVYSSVSLHKGQYISRLEKLTKSTLSVNRIQLLQRALSMFLQIADNVHWLIYFIIYYLCELGSDYFVLL